MSNPVISTPCIRVCAVDGRAGLCVGCGRTLKEIVQWTGFTEAQRLEIMAGLPARLETLQPSAEPGA
jgi:hypothetical protein